ncbi:hypothetical protein [Haloarcula amylovorans]|uniref:hypothetical protein n=1 Tax=Haloarcula amylovorans TaxID=2562280 RepID=UPI0010765493|nr:hypothetical protein [Halomicroarcula amylolytica]
MIQFNMKGPAMQRLSILLMLFGGFLEMAGGLRGNYAGLPAYGLPIMVVALLVGGLGLFLVLSNNR